MSQEQPRKTEPEPLAIKYGDVFDVQGELALKPITPQDAAMMQAAENMTVGKTVKGGPAAVMQSAATANEQRGVVEHFDDSDVAREQGVTVTETYVGGRRIVTESVGDQVVGQYTQPTTEGNRSSANVTTPDAITIGEALEATALSAGDKPVDQSDASAIHAAEVRATGLSDVLPGGVAATAQSAAAHNLRVMRDEDKTKLGDILDDATQKLGTDKPATREDAEGVIGAELRNNPAMATHPGGVAECVAAAARLNMK